MTEYEYLNQIVDLLRPCKLVISGQYQSTSETPFKWRLAGRPKVARFIVLTKCEYGIAPNSHLLAQLFITKLERGQR